MAGLRFEVAGDVELSRNLNVLIDKLDNLDEFFDDALDLVEKKSERIFATKGAVVEKGSKWKGLAKSTKKARSRRWGYYKSSPSSPSVLRWTGNLQKSKYRRVSKKQAEFGYTADYAIHHQKPYGKNPPTRKIIDFDNQLNTEMVRALQKKINKDIGISGLQD